MGTVDCDTSALGDFLYNDMFTVVANPQFFVKGRLSFPLGDNINLYDRGRVLRADGSYRTRFGPCVSHNGVIYENSDSNVALALSRLTAARSPLVPGYHDHLKNVQRDYVRRNSQFLDTLRVLYTPDFIDYYGADLEAEVHYMDPHEKRALRVQAWRELNESGERYDKLWLKSVTYKMKKNEIAKPGKVPRMIGDLGVSASLQGFRVTKFLKIAQAKNSIFYGGGEIQFVASPDPWQLENVFNKLLAPPGRYYMALFSDDSCFSIRTQSGVDIYNVDISKCDASHSEAIFDGLVRITPSVGSKDVETLTEQCALPIRIQSVSNKKNVLVLRPKHKVLYSGSTLTTAINNLATTLIGKSFADCQYTGSESLIAAALNVGYVITLDKCVRMEDVQFLKHSPVLDVNGKIRPLMNLGVLLRLSGTCNGDLPGRGDLVQRGKAFQASLLAGAYPYAQFKLLSGFKSAAGLRTTSSDLACAKLFEHKVVSVKYPHYVVDESSMYSRYQLTDLDVVDLEEFSVLGYGHHLSGEAVDKVLSKDYGLKSKII